MTSTLILTLTKHHGLGNDFLILIDLEDRTPLTAELARALCDRHRGIGADGLIRATRPPATPPATPPARPPATLTFELRNADGSPAEMSGNGLRCLAQAALDRGLIPARTPVTIQTPAGPREITAAPAEGHGLAWVSVDMGVPAIDGEADRCNVGHGNLRVNLGNPHLVVLGPDPATVDVEKLGPDLEASQQGGQNVEFVALGPGPDEITMRVWERGVGETLACGTGACAAAVAVHHWGRTGTHVTVHQPGGDAAVALRPDGHVVLEGPSQRIATCTVEWPR
jgi:diaminopimelate epimerase